MNPESKGTVTIEGKLTTLRYELRLPHPREVIWKAITDPNELVMWFNTKAVIDGRTGGTIDFINAPSGFHTTGCILNWDQPHIFEHEWHIAPHPDLPHGEPEAIMHSELIHDGDSNTILILTFSHLARFTAQGFAPGMHAFLDRLSAHLNGEKMPDWMQRYVAVKEFYCS